MDEAGLPLNVPHRFLDMMELGILATAQLLCFYFFPLCCRKRKEPLKQKENYNTEYPVQAPSPAPQMEAVWVSAT